MKRLKEFLKANLYRKIESYEIEMNELKEKQRNGAEIIDVRSACEYNEGHISGAVNIPEYEIDTKFEKIYPNKTGEIVLYCQIGKRSRTAYRKLKRMNYKNVYCLYGGIDNY